jgi:Heparan-alpha-glucosaminide N-acetyltransferase, catalytic
MTRARDVGVDALRGVALVSMYVAHTAPVSRLSAFYDLSEYLTYPLFAALVGMGAALGSRSSFGPAAVRGAVLVVVGLLLERLDTNVIIILVYLGLLTWIAYPLARCRTSVVAGTGAAALALAPPVRDSLLDTRVDLYTHGHPTAARLLDYVATGDEYQLLSVIGFAAVGIVLVRLTRASQVLVSASRQVLVGTAVLVAAAAYGAVVRTGPDPMRPYEATWREHGFCLLLVCATSLILLGLVPRLGVIASTLAAMGQMALTLYAAQVCYLWLWAHFLDPGVSDDRWSNTALLTLGSAAVALCWRRLVPAGPARRGPLEGIAEVLVRAHLGRPRAATS